MNAPVRLTDDSASKAGALLSKLPAAEPPPGAVERGWRAIQQPRRAHPLRWFLLGAACAAAVAVLLVHRPAPIVTAPVTAVVAPQPRTTLTPSATAIYEQSNERVTLTAGRLTVRADGESLEIRTPVEIFVLSQAFASVEVMSDGAVLLSVEEGEVFLRGRDRWLRAGETLTLEVPREKVVAPKRKLAVPQPDDHERFRRALALRKTDATAAAALFREMANDSSHAEVALYELARLQPPAEAVKTYREALRRFPAGALQHEAKLGLVEALLATNNAQEALRVLDGVEAPERAAELNAMRGELLHALGRFADAAQVLQPVTLGADVRAQKALIVLADCEARLGHADAARALLEEYLRRFPSGAYATTARNALQKN